MNNNNCLFCQSKNIKTFKTKDYNRFTDELNFTFCYCFSCNCVSNLSKSIDLNIYYNNPLSPYDIDDYNYNKITNKNKYFLKLIKKFISKGKILEIGPGFGYLSKLLNDEKYLITIIEQDKELCDFYRKKLQIYNVKNADIINFKMDNQKYNAIIAFQVFEHLDNPNKWIKNISKALDDNGYLFLSTPNSKSIQFKIMKNWWPHLDAPRHQMIYSSSSLEKFLNNYKLVKIYESWGIDTILWNLFGWNNFFRTIFNIKKNNIITKLLGYFFFTIFFFIEIIPGFGASYIHVYKKTN
tara:strand:- start:24199 stop:25086 length:888 start_codon:yes stop_codon:yes gene_type:complete